MRRRARIAVAGLVVTGLVVLPAVLTALPAAAVALTSAAVPTPPPGTRPVDPSVSCQGRGPQVVELPPAQRRLAASSTWAVTTGAGVRVAVVGAGVDASHPQLDGQVERGIDVVYPGAFGDADCVGMGTVVAGLIAATDRPAIGFHGMAPDASIVPVRVTLDGLDTTPELLALGIDAAVAEGATVVLVTLPLPFTSAALAESVAAAERADVVVVAPADPLPEDLPGFTYPAAYESVVAVNALDAEGVPAAVGAGPSVVDLVAPGEGVVGPLPGGGHTVAITGTVPAAAYVAGTVALVRAAHPELDAAEVRRRLELTADHTGIGAPDPAAGWGVVNPVLAVSAEVATAPREPVADPIGEVAGPQPPPPPDRTVELRALWLALGGALIAAGLLIGAKVVPSGQRRGWRPGRSAGPEAVPDAGPGSQPTPR